MGRLFSHDRLTCESSISSLCARSPHGRRADGEAHMTETTSAPRVAQRDHTPPSLAKAVAGSPPRSTADNQRAAQIMAAFGAANEDFLGALFFQLVGIGSQNGEINDDEIRFMCSVVTGIKPRDRLETMLAAQLIATMTSARRLRGADNIQKRDSAERAFNKLARTFATQMEALTRYRTGGEQKVMVQHVSVSEGGQAAIVGNVTQGPRETAVNGAASGT